MCDDSSGEVASRIARRRRRREPPPQLRRLRRVASAALAVFALFFLLGSETVRGHAFLGMIATALAILLSYVIRLDPGGDDEPAE
ncbi:MAG: hypothetical protein ACLQLG_01620 [Thermoguttaceae bacterium]